MLNIAPPPISEPEAEARLAQNNGDMLALGAKADHRLIAGDHRAAASFYNAVVRMAEAGWARDAASADLARRAGQMVQMLARKFCDHIDAAIDQAGYPRQARPERFQQAVEILFGERERPRSAAAFPQLPKLLFYPGLPQVEFADPARFPWKDRLEACFPAMRAEAEQVLADGRAFSPYVTRVANRPQGDAHGLLENPDWSSFYLWQNGKPVEENASQCPGIFRGLTNNVPLFDVAGRSPSAYLSLLRPGAHIPPHTGMLNCRYICHLPLVVPPGCGFRVGGTTVEWQEGRLMVFDDSVDHEAWNRGSQDRLILLFEVWSPDLTDLEIKLIRVLLEAVDTYR